MTRSSQKNRIIFIDLMRAFAVLMMVQGHTTDVLLSNDYRNFDNPLFVVWFFMRGMTAPIFLFTSGTVFTYLFRLNNEPFNSNPRVTKGIKRFLLLVFLGYMLRYPTPTLFDFSRVGSRQWEIFFSVDILHLIGFGLLFVIILAYLSEKLKAGDYLVFSLAALFFFISYLYTENIKWIEFVPAPIAGYLYKGTGSNFPLFPWLGYLLSGAVLGSYLAKNPDVFRSAKFSLYLLLIGALLLAAAISGDKIYLVVGEKGFYWNESIYYIFIRLGFVLVLTSVVSLISIKISVIPKIFILVGRNTLIIYVVHLVILYGSAWNPGIISLYHLSFTAARTALSALFMLSLMIGMVILINKLKIKNKQMVT
jgi:uncharacterized membrane protein